MSHASSLDGKLVVLIGGSGFFGSHIAQDLLDRGARLRIASRTPDDAFRLKPLANLGQMQFFPCSVTHEGSVEAAVRDADAVVYLVGAFAGNLQALHADGAGIVARKAAEAGAASFVHISAIGADDTSTSTYAQTKAAGEQQVKQAFPNATILRPSALFGEDDNFINMFASIIASFPIVPVFGANARLQPLWVDDAAEAVGNALANPAAFGGQIYEIAGPDILTMGEINRRIAEGQERDRSFIEVPNGIARLFAALPGTPLNKDQLIMLSQGNIASGHYPGIADLNVHSKPLSLFLDRWMVRYRKHGRFTAEEASV
ncbi:complex I NDUFA9 subunit family protein [Altericroceibacterium spongiae]|uniref:Complex I NDUFA9 subunit family protein n=1 Tax=Altericroceibacterium spongiae TaxID=2320269 RepID=A0A420EJ43_9SPHN|nr:complex I NDUFA9 subunit family protein [Altericroceibacterium spongiae]RKF20687.1 complex I NDUFA9 subunit family protein [Altericroceibacterium spongiae]